MSYEPVFIFLVKVMQGQSQGNTYNSASPNNNSIIINNNDDDVVVVRDDDDDKGLCS